MVKKKEEKEKKTPRYSTRSKRDRTKDKVPYMTGVPHTEKSATQLARHYKTAVKTAKQNAKTKGVKKISKDHEVKTLTKGYKQFQKKECAGIAPYPTAFFVPKYKNPRPVKKKNVRGHCKCKEGKKPNCYTLGEKYIY